jgi:hypothetical protein
MRDRVTPYYALAIASHLYRERYSQARLNIQNEYTYRDAETDKVVNLLFDEGAFEKALRQLNSDEFIELIEDEFGPEIIVPREALYYWMNNVQERDTVWYKYSVGGDSWLRAALKKIYDQMVIPTQEDTLSPADELPKPDVWQPIKYERFEIDPVIETLELAVKEIAENNGYAAEHAIERNYVVNTLRAGLQQLKLHGEIALLQIQTFILEPLAIALTRFKDAATGLAIEGAKEAVKEFIKDKVKGSFDGFF